MRLGEMAVGVIAGERGGIPQIEFAWLQIAIVRQYEARPGSGPLMADSLPYLPRLSFGICLLSDSIDACNKQISICRRAAYVGMFGVRTNRRTGNWFRSNPSQSPQRAKGTRSTVR